MPTVRGTCAICQQPFERFEPRGTRPTLCQPCLEASRQGRPPTPNLRKPGAAEAFPNEAAAKRRLEDRGIDVEASFSLWMLEIRES